GAERPHARRADCRARARLPPSAIEVRHQVLAGTHPHALHPGLCLARPRHDRAAVSLPLSSGDQPPDAGLRVTFPSPPRGEERTRTAHVPTGLVPVDRQFLHKQRLAPPDAPTGLVPVERRLLHKRRHAPRPAPTGLAPVERRLVHQRGGRRSAPLCPSPCSTGASPVGAEKRGVPFLCRNHRYTGTSPVGAGCVAQAGLSPSLFFASSTR